VAIVSLILIAVLAGIDQLLKYIVVQNMQVNDSITVIPGLLDWCYIQNRGAAFGMLEDQQWLFLVITCVVVAAALVVLFSKICNNWMLRGIIILMAAGGIGNMIDRTANGYVVDYISLSFFPPIFNFADICVCVAAAAMMVYVLWGEKWFHKKPSDGEKQENEIEHSDQ